MLSKNRRRKLFFLGLCVCFAAWVGGFVWFLAETPHRKPDWATLNVDAIVVFTGGNGRVPAALELGKHTALPVLVSGVNPGVTEAELLTMYALPEDAHDVVTLDYAATSTRENVEQTLSWAKERQVRHILLVTSFYHMPRSLELFRQAQAPLQITPYPVYSTQEDLWFLIREYHKFLLAKVGLI